MNTQHDIESEAQMCALGRQLAATLSQPALITLSGDLGAGKSVLVRAMIHALGYEGAVKSPTYTLVETYNVSAWQIAHLDLYRLNDPDELQFIGFRDIIATSDLVLIEWPDRAGTLLPEADISITIEYYIEQSANSRRVSIMHAQ